MVFMEGLDLITRIYGLALVCMSLLIWSYAVLVVPATCQWKKPGVGFVVPFVIGVLAIAMGKGTDITSSYIFAEVAGMLVVAGLAALGTRLMYSPELVAAVLGSAGLFSWVWFSMLSVRRFLIYQNPHFLWLPFGWLLLLAAIQLARTRKWPDWGTPTVILAASYPGWLFLSGNRLFLPIFLKTLGLVWLFACMYREAVRVSQAELQQARTVLEDFERAVGREVKLRMLELERAKQRLADKASTDALTGALNKKALLQEIDSLLVARDRDVFCLLMFDIDEFKQLNDKLGHVAGDMALKRLSRIVKSSIREGDIFGRYGGDEFIVVFPHTPLSDARLIAERIRQRVENDKTGPPITLSMGLAAYPLDGETGVALVKAADEGLYLSKSKGRNRVSHVRTEQNEQ